MRMQFVTYGDLFTFTLVIVGIIDIVFTILAFAHKKK